MNREREASQEPDPAALGGRASTEPVAAVLRRVVAEERTTLAIIGPRDRRDKPRITHLGALEAVEGDRLLIHGTSYPFAEGLRRVRVVHRSEDRAAIHAAREAYHAALAQLDRAAAAAWSGARAATRDDLEGAWAQVRREVGEARGDRRRLLRSGRDIRRAPQLDTPR